MQEENLLKMNLQLLAGEDDSGDDIDDNDVGGNSDDNVKSEKKYSDDVDRIIEKKLEKWKKQQQKEIDEAKKLADMNAQQKTEYERDKLQEELDELRNAKTISEI